MYFGCETQIRNLKKITRRETSAAGVLTCASFAKTSPVNRSGFKPHPMCTGPENTADAKIYQQYRAVIFTYHLLDPHLRSYHYEML
jgi:hypothetical protein